MTLTVHTYTSIHVGADPDLPTPYTVLVLADGQTRRVVRTDGIPAWVAIGRRVTLYEDGDRIAVAPEEGTAAHGG